MNIQQTLELAKKHQQSGRLPEAEALYRQILQRQPKRDDVLQQLAILAFQMGRFGDAEQYFRSAIAANFRKAEYHHGLGLCLNALGRFDDAMSSVRQAIAIRPNFANAHNDLGIFLVAQRRMPEAIAEFELAVAARPEFPEAENNLGNTLAHEGQMESAVAAFRRAIALRPNYAEGLSNLSNALTEMGDLDEGIAAARRAIQSRPDYSPAYNNLANAFLQKEDPDEAILACRRALELAPDAPHPLNNLANALRSIGRLDEAVGYYRRVEQVRPDDAAFGSNLVLLSFYDPGQNPRGILDQMRLWNDRYARPLRPTHAPHDNDGDPQRRLRIGYVSPDFRNHPVGRNLLPLLTRHDHDQFEIFCYSNARRGDAITEKFRASAQAWREIRAVDDAQAAQMIRQDRIDILMDLAGHTAHNRLTLFAHKPAPIQATFGGYPGGTGLETMDYRLTDHFLDPPELGDEFYSEKIIRLPDSFWCYDPDAMDVRQTIVAPLPAQQNGFITFGCLNNFCKINPQTLRLWSKVLSAVPSSRLLLLAPPGSSRSWVLQHLAIDADRIQFVPAQARKDYLSTYDRIDLGLDTQPYNGHTTSLDSLWMGVPVLTLIGATSFGRAGWSQLNNLKLQELAARDEEQFVKLASELADNQPRLADLRRGLRQRMEQSPLTDAVRFARNIESAYRQMWRNWCGQPNKA